MFQVYVLLLFCWAVSMFYQRMRQADDMVSGEDSDEASIYRKFGNIAYLVLLLTLIVFSGTRTRFNDTGLYLTNYLKIASDSYDASGIFGMSLGDNPGFYIYQIIISRLSGGNTMWFLTVSAVIVAVSFIALYRRYSKNFALSVYLFIASTFFIFSMAALKQILATAIAIWILPLCKEKKWIPSLILLLVAITFHPYVIVFAIIPLLLCDIWSFRMITGVVIVLFAGSNFSTTVGVLIDVAQSIGDEYDIEWWNDNGVNVFRLAVYSVTPVLSIIFRKQINESDDTIQKACVNLSAASMLFMYLAFLGGANMFGRMASYFEPFTYIALPNIIEENFSERLRKPILIACMLLYAIFYFVFFSKYGVWLFADYFNHVSISGLFT